MPLALYTLTPVLAKQKYSTGDVISFMPSVPGERDLVVRSKYARASPLIKFYAKAAGELSMSRWWLIPEWSIQADSRHWQFVG